MPRCTLLILGSAITLVLSGPRGVQAQSASRVDVEAEVGHGFGLGLDLPRVGLGSTVWVTRAWGLSVGYSSSLGEDHREDLPTQSEYQDIVNRDLRYWRIGFRYRRSIAGRSSVLIGAGYMDGTFANIDFLKQPRGGQIRFEYVNDSNNLFGELHLQRQLGAWASVRGGATLLRDIVLEGTPWFFTPTVAFVLTF